MTRIFPKQHVLEPKTGQLMTMPWALSACAWKRRTRPSAPTTVPTRRHGARLHSLSLSSSRIHGCPETFYTDVAPKVILTHLQAGCTVRHTLNLLTIHNEMQRYHLEVEGIPEYINMLEDAQKQAGRAGQIIAYKTLLLFTSTSMLTADRYPRDKNNWRDRSEGKNTWAH